MYEVRTPVFLHSRSQEDTLFCMVSRDQIHGKPKLFLEPAVQKLGYDLLRTFSVPAFPRNGSGC